MDVSEDILKLIEEYAGLFLTCEEIAALIDIEISEFTSEIYAKKGAVYRAYLRGKTFSKMEIRKNVVKMAKYGSPQAEAQAEKFIIEQELSEEL